MKSPIIILHGWGSSSQAWQTPKKLFESKGFAVFTPDLPGFGKEKPPKTPWSVSDYVNFVLKYAQKKGLEKFLLIGHSFGGRVAIKLAALYPEKMRGLILTGVPLGPRRTLKVFAFFILSKIGKIIFLVPPFPFLIPWFRKLLYRLVGEWDYYKTTGVMRQVFKNVINEYLTPFLSKIKSPTLILWGNEDKVTPISLTHLIRDKIPQAKFVSLPGASHKFPYEQPEIFVEEVIKFLTYTPGV